MLKCLAHVFLEALWVDIFVGAEFRLRFSNQSVDHIKASYFVSEKVNESKIWPVCRQPVFKKQADGQVFLSSKSRQVSLDRLFSGTFEAGRKKRNKRWYTGPVTDFAAEQVILSCLKPIRDSVSCRLTLFCLPVWNSARKKTCREKPV